MQRVNKGILLIAMGMVIGLYVLLEVQSPVRVSASFPDYGAVLLKYGGYLMSGVLALIGLYLAVSSPNQS
jgi:hypothetical protein